MSDIHTSDSFSDIAIIGMSGRFPGAKNIDGFWQNLCAGIESVSFLSEAQLAASGIDRALLDDPDYVRAKGVLEGADLFDASFFGYSPREAEIMDPQQRLLLECAWEALENAGYDAEAYDGRIGVYAGVGLNSYLLLNVLANRGYVESVGDLQFIGHGNDKDYVTTRVSYKMNLRGPSVNVQSACSTSLVAVCVAYQSLLNGECDMALAGGAFISVPLRAGYLYREGSIFSPDGHCCAFDAKARGTVFGDGVGVVVLKRLANALADRDYVYAVMKGSAINNDGSSKVSYAAPSVESQAEVIAEAMGVAAIEPETVTYVETHGTGTSLGDPIEIAALTQAYCTSTDTKSFCAIGSVKTNIGHLDAASGVAGLIKTALALKRELLPPSLNYSQPNPEIDFANSPFYVNTELSTWKAGENPRRAGVSSFGVGGTNAHVILEEAPVVEGSSLSGPFQVLTLSAKTATALNSATDHLVEHLKQHPDINLADVAYTLQVGRKTFPHRRAALCRDLNDAVTALGTLDPSRVFTAKQEATHRPVVFMFSGQGAQYVNMGLDLYHVEPTFREQVNLCSELLRPHLGLDLRDLLYPGGECASEALQQLTQTVIAQPAIFVIEYALSRLWMEWGVHPEAVIGHSIGEFAAACLAGVFSLEDALALVSARGQLMQSLPAGTMLVVPLPEKEVESLLGDGLSLAVINGPSLCVVSGATDAVEASQNRLAEMGVQCRRLHTSHAFHSSMMDPMLGAFAERVRTISLKAPQIPYVSNVTGEWIEAAQVTDPDYWVRHVRQTVRFSDGVQHLLKEPGQILLEVGPGRTLSSLVKRHPGKESEQAVFASLRHPHDHQSDVAFTLTTMAKLWLAGAHVNWTGLHTHERRLRVPLPTYPFERKQYWLTAGDQSFAAPSTATRPSRSVEKNPLTRRSDEVLVSGEYDGAPSDDVERLVAATWEAVLGVEPVKAHDDFFELGGHSLLATQVISRLRGALRVELSIRDLFDAQTVAELAQRIRKLRGQAQENAERIADGSGKRKVSVQDRSIGDLPAEKVGPLAVSLQDGGMAIPHPPIVPATRESDTLPLSSSQERLWFLNQLQPDNASDHISVGFHLTGSLDVRALEMSLDEIVKRHEVLRTTFAESNGQPVQEIGASWPLSVLEIDLQAFNESEQAAEVLRQATGEAQELFDPTKGPLFRARLLHIGDKESTLLLTMHHIVSDGWSLGVLYEELAVLYKAFSTGKHSPLSDLPIQYADYALWQRQWLRGEALESQLSYWKQQLSGSLPVVELPMARLRPAAQTFRGAKRFLTLPGNLYDALKALSQRERCTPFMTLLAALQTLLHRYTGQDDIIVGSPTANRNQSELEGLIGLFLNMLVLRTDLSGNPTFRELLGRVREVTLGAYANQDAPFEKLVEVLQPSRDLSRSPLFQVMLEVSPMEEALELSGLSVSPLEFDSGTAQYDLAIHLHEEAEGLAGYFEYNTDLFDGPAIDKLAGHFQALLGSIVSNPGQRISDLPFLSGEERHQLLAGWNNTQVDYPRHACIHQLIEAQVERTPDVVSVVFEDQELTYRQLNGRANQVAHYLRKLNVGPEVCVGIYIERSLDMIVGLLGILKAGGAYLPLDHTYPAELIAYMVQDARIPVLLTQARFVKNLPEHQARVVQLDAEWHKIAAESEQNVHSGVTADNLSYLMYTSGSTGKPKGVMVCHSNVVNFFTGMDAPIPHDPPGVWLAVTSLSFDISVLELFWTLARGFKVILHTDETRDSALEEIEQGARGHSIPAQIIQHNVTHFQCTPSMASMLLADDETRAALRSVQTFMVGGEALPATLATQLSKVVSGEVINMYGPTETTVWSATYSISDYQNPIPIGRPIANTSIYIVDQNVQPVPVGVAGELLIGGDGVTRGYLYRPDLTAARFVKHPFSEKPDARLYRTGDMACYRPDGNIEFLGRIDHQVKIRGHRIELGEIETLLEQHPVVREAVVMAREDAPGDKRIVAYTVLEQNQGLSGSQLRDYIKQKLPQFMVPSHFITLDVFPLTPNRKIDRRALPAPDLVQVESGVAYVAPRDESEQTLVNIWQELLNVANVSMNDNFFDLGGHSLLLVSLSARVKKAFGQDLPLSTFFQAPTAKQLASILRHEESSTSGFSRGKIQRARSKRVKDTFWMGLRNRLLQAIALSAPGAETTRPWLHRMRGVRIGDNAFIGLGVVIESAYPRLVSIGNNVGIGLRTVIIAHFKGSAERARVSDEPSVRIEDDAYIGPGVIILPNVSVGKGAVVAAGSVVNSSVPPLTMVQGNPAKPVGRCGIPLAGNSYGQFIRELRPFEDLA